MSEPKYIKVNGVTKLNPKYQKTQPSSLTQMEQQNALPVYTSKQEYENHMNYFGQPAKLSASAEATEMMCQDEDVQKIVGTSNLTQDISQVLAKYEIPFGLVNKLMEFQTYSYLFFMIDDSGSMNAGTDSQNHGRQVTRWEETRMRLLEMIEILSYVPTPEIVIAFLNRRNEIRLMRRTGLPPQQFMAEATNQINQAFSQVPGGTTPYLRRMEEVFRQYSQNRMAWYFFSDGVPDGGFSSQQRILNLCVTRRDPEGNPITFFSCTDEDDQVEWMKNIEEIAPFCSEFDDYRDEKEEVLKDQGMGLPFTKGFYLIGSLVAAMNPDDLDSMDESIPLTKAMLDNLLGYVSDESDYRSYFDKFIQSQQKRPNNEQMDRIKREINWQSHYNAFITSETHRNIPAAMDFKMRLKQANAAANGMQSYGQNSSYGSSATPYNQSNTSYGNVSSRPPPASYSSVPPNQASLPYGSGAPYQPAGNNLPYGSAAPIQATGNSVPYGSAAPYQANGNSLPYGSAAPYRANGNSLPYGSAAPYQATGNNLPYGSAAPNQATYGYGGAAPYQSSQPSYGIPSPYQQSQQSYGNGTATPYQQPQVPYNAATNYQSLSSGGILNQQAQSGQPAYGAASQQSRPYGQQQNYPPPSYPPK
jgi:hypothetical protein